MHNTETMASMFSLKSAQVAPSGSPFSDHNAPYMADISDCMEDDTPARRIPLQRQTNEWINYFGEYPGACAEIIGDIQPFIGRTGTHSARHVLQLPVNSMDLKLYPTNREIATVQRNVRDNVEVVYTQLEIFADNGSMTFIRTTGGAEINYQGETIFVNFYISEESSMFHVVISKLAFNVSGRPFSKVSELSLGNLYYPDMNNVSSLIYCLRMIFITPGLFTSFDFDLDEDDIERASSVTLELSLVLPKESLPEEPEWLNDAGASWNVDPSWIP
jgi:hypothetical protein